MHFFSLFFWSLVSPSLFCTCYFCFFFLFFPSFTSFVSIVILEAGVECVRVAMSTNQPIVRHASSMRPLVDASFRGLIVVTEYLLLAI